MANRVLGVLGLEIRRKARLGTTASVPGARIDITDNFTELVCYANAGMLDPGNLYCFDHAIKNLSGDAPLIEVGSWCGLSANLLNYYKSRHGVRNALVTCDPWTWGNGPLRNTSIFAPEYMEHVLDTFRRNVRMFSRNDLPYSIRKTSDDFFSAWRRAEEVTDVFGRIIKLGGPVSFCYIDGNHSYKSVGRDFENTDEFLMRGGFILFDDSAEDSNWEGVRRAVAEVQASGRYELVTRNPNYFFRKK